jgi:hypothetical protein
VVDRISCWNTTKFESLDLVQKRIFGEFKANSYVGRLYFQKKGKEGTG